MVSANQSALELVQALGRAEWGPLAGAEWRCPRVLLGTLSQMMWDARRDRAGTIATTARQIAAQAGYSERWTRTALQVLEDIGLISWHRGGIRDGRPTVSVLKIIKTKLVELIRLARPTHDAKEKARRAETMRRLSRIRVFRVASKLPRLVHAEVSASPTSTRGTARAQGDAAPRFPERNYSRKDQKMKAKRQSLDIHYLPSSCRHGIGKPIVCPDCRAIALRIARDAAESSAASSEQQLPVLPTVKAIKPDPMPTLSPHAVAVSIYENYMRNTYPGTHPRHWYKLEQDDEQARELAQACK